MMNTEACEAQTWTPIMCRLGKGYIKNDVYNFKSWICEATPTQQIFFLKFLGEEKELFVQSGLEGVEVII